MMGGDNQFKIFLGLELEKNAGTTLNQDIQRLTKNGINLKVGLDESSLNALTTAINGVTQQLEKMGGLGNRSGKAMADSFTQANKSLTPFRDNIVKVTEEYKKGVISAEEYSRRMGKALMMDSDKGLSPHFANQFENGELEQYLALVKNVGETVREIKPIGELFKTQEVSVIKGQTAELTKEIKTYKDDMGGVQTITSLINKETGELVATTQKLVTLEQYKDEQLEKQNLTIAKQGTSLEKYRRTVQEINTFGLNMIKSGNATSADNDIIKNANAIKKEYEELNKLNNDGVVIEDIRIQKFKTLLEKQANLIGLKDTEIKKSEQLEQALYERDRLTKQMQESFNKQNTSYSTGVDESEKNAVQELINAYSKLDPSKENMKRRTDELKDSVNSYNQKIKESATLEQKQEVAMDKHAIAVMKLQNAFKNTNKKYSLGVDEKQSSEMKDMINAFKELDPLSEGYAQTLELVRVKMGQYTVETRDATKELNAQITNINRLNNIQQSFNSYKNNAKGMYDTSQAKEIQETMNQMQMLIASGEDVKLMFGSLISKVSQFGKATTASSKQAKKEMEEEQKLYKFKEQSLIKLDVLRKKYEKNHINTAPIDALIRQLNALEANTDDAREAKDEFDIAFARATSATQIKSLSTTMTSVFKTATGFFGLYSVFGYMRDAFASITKEVTTLDNAMIGLKRVTDEAQYTYEAFQNSAFNTANDIGGTAKEIVDSASEFAKLGYGFQEATQLATSATKYATVGEIALTEATDALSASYTVFGGTVDETMGKLIDSTSIIDLYNKIGNTMAVTSSDIGEAMKASANSLSVANNSLSESVALIATANKTIQDSSKVGNALRTISMRIRGIDEDTGELIPKMKELIQQTTNGKVNIMDGEEFKSTYQIMLEISEVWDELSDKQRAYLGENIAGKNRAEVFMALMGNAEDLSYAMEMAKESIGSVDQEMAIVMQSFEKRLEVMKNAWASLANTTLDSGFVKGIVDSTTEVIKFTDACGGLLPVLASVGVGFAIFKGRSIIDGVSTLSGAFTALKANLVGTTAVAISLQSVLTFGAIGIATGVIMGVGYALNYASKEAERLSEAIMETEKRLSDLNNEILALEGVEHKTEAQEERLKLLREEAILREKILLAQQKQQAQDQAGGVTVNKDGEVHKASPYNTGELGDVSESIYEYQEIQKEIDKLREKQKGLSKDSQEYIGIQDKINSKINDARETRLALSTTLGLLKDKYDLLTDTQKEQYDMLQQLAGVAIEDIDKLTGDFDMSDIIGKNRDALQALIVQQDSAKGSTIDYEAEAKKLGITATELEYALASLREEQERGQDGDAVVETTSSLGEMFAKSAESSDLLRTSLAELNKENTLSEDTIDKLVKKYPELANKITDVESAYVALNEIITEQAFDDATKGIADLVSVLEDLEAGNGITASSFKKISDNFPELLAYMTDEASLTDAINSKMTDLKNVQNEAYKQMLLNSESYYKANVQGNEQMVNSISKGIEDLFRNLGTAYQGDLKNWKSLAQGKADIESQLINELNKAWQSHFGTIVSTFNKMPNTPIAQAQFDREAYAQKIKSENPFILDSQLQNQLNAVEGAFKNQSNNINEYYKSISKLGDLFSDIEFDPIDIKVGGTKAESSKKDKSKNSAYISSIFKEIVEEILKGGEEIEKTMGELDIKLQNAVLKGDLVLEEQILGKLSNLQVEIRDKQASMAKELDAQIAEMGKILSETGVFKAYDMAKLTSKDMAEVIQNIEKQINSATLKDNSSEVNRLNNLKSLINDVGGVYLSTIEDRRELSSKWWEEENTRLEKYAENVEKFYSRKFDELDREDKILQLRKSMLLEDSDRYDKEEKESDQILQLNQNLYENIVKRRGLCENQISALRAKGFSEESEEIQTLIDEWLDYEQTRLDLIKEIAESRRQASINSAQRELDDLSKAKEKIGSLLDLTIEMLKKETEAKKEALKEQNDAKKEALKEEYEAEKKALNDKLQLIKDEANAKKSELDKEKSDKNYKEKVAEKQKEIDAIQQQIIELSNDNSVSSVKKRKELEAQLDKYLKELGDIQYDREIEQQKNAIDEELKSQEDKINTELENLESQHKEELKLLEEKYKQELKEYDDYLKNQSKLKDEANKLIESKDKKFYERLKTYALDYTSMTKAEFQDCWDSAYEALDKYGSKQLSVIDVIEQMTQRVIELNKELTKLNDSSYKDFIGDGDYGFAGDKPNSGNSGNNSSSSNDKYDGLTDKEEKAEFRDKQLKKMIELGDEMNRTPSADTEAILSLKKQQEEIAKTIGAWRGSDGTWYINIEQNGKAKQFRVRDAVGVRHTGLETGEVGSPWGSFKIKSNEELNKLEKGEIVLNTGQTEQIMKNVKTLAQSNQQGSVDVVIDMHDFNVTEDSLPKFEKLLKDRVPKIINQTIFSKAIK